MFPVGKINEDRRDIPSLQNSRLNTEVSGEIQITVDGFALQLRQIARSDR
jgi:hypothetical protein